MNEQLPPKDLEHYEEIKRKIEAGEIPGPNPQDLPKE